MTFDLTEDLDAVFDTDDLAFLADYTPPAGPAVVGIQVHLSEGVQEVALDSGEVLDQADTITFKAHQVSAPVENGEVALTEAARTFRLLALVRRNRILSEWTVREL